MDHSISIRIDNNAEGDGGGTAGIASGGSLPTPSFSGIASGVNQFAMDAPTPPDSGNQVDMVAPAPSPDFFSGGSAASADIPTPFSDGASEMASASGELMPPPTPMDTMVPGGPGDQVPMPSLHTLPDIPVSAGLPSPEGSGGEAKK